MPGRPTTSPGSRDRRDAGLLRVLVGDGRPLLQVTALALFFSGAFAVFLASRREFLPHDVAFLRMTPDDLCAIADCRIVDFMFHDRVAFGGALIAIGLLYLWLTAVPLAQGAAWAWTVLTVSGGLGFGSFLAYLGYGYLDTWHGVGSVFLLPLFAVGLFLSRQHLRKGRAAPAVTSSSGRSRAGRWLLVATGGGMILAGGTITVVGMTSVFVPQDLTFMGLSAETLDAVNQRLIPLIAHDRAGFGGALVSCGSIVMGCAWYAQPSRSLWEALGAAGAAGFGAAIGVHLVVGYTDAFHLAPAVAGALLFCVGLLLTVGSRTESGESSPDAERTVG